MTDQPDLTVLTGLQLRIMNTMAARDLAVDLDPREPGGFSNQAMAAAGQDAQRQTRGPAVRGRRAVLGPAGLPVVGRLAPEINGAT
jgi:hypothetical protein